MEVLDQFSGSGDPESWLFRAERYFTYLGFAEKDWLPLPSFYLDSEALNWFNWLFQNNQFFDWTHFKAKFALHFRQQTAIYPVRLVGSSPVSFDYINTVPIVSQSTMVSSLPVSSLFPKTSTFEAAYETESSKADHMFDKLPVKYENVDSVRLIIGSHTEVVTLEDIEEPQIWNVNSVEVVDLVQEPFAITEDPVLDEISLVVVSSDMHDLNVPVHEGDSSVSFQTKVHMEVLDDTTRSADEEEENSRDSTTAGVFDKFPQWDTSDLLVFTSRGIVLSNASVRFAVIELPFDGTLWFRTIPCLRNSLEDIGGVTQNQVSLCLDFGSQRCNWVDTGQERDRPGFLSSKSREFAREKKIQKGLQVLAKSYSTQSPHIRVTKATRLVFSLFGLVHKTRSGLPYIIFDPGPYVDYDRFPTLSVFIVANHHSDCICSTCLYYSLHFFVWIVVTVSCALPYLFKAQGLLAKDTNRILVPYYTLFQLEPDGSLEFYFSMMQLKELFNVNNFIVSEEHPHFAPLLQIQEFDGAYGGTIIHDCVGEYFSDYNETFGGECPTHIVLASQLEDKIYKRHHKVLQVMSTVQAVCVILGMDFFSSITAICSSLNDHMGVPLQKLFTNTFSSLGFPFILTNIFPKEFTHEEKYWCTVVNQPNVYGDIFILVGIQLLHTDIFPLFDPGKFRYTRERNNMEDGSCNTQPWPPRITPFSDFLLDILNKVVHSVELRPSSKRHAVDSWIDKLNNAVMGHIFPTTEDNLDAIIIQHDRGRIAHGLATVGALMCDFLAALSTRFKHHPHASASYHWILVHEEHSLKCEPHETLQKLNLPQRCRSISSSQTQRVSFVGCGRGSIFTIPGYAFNTGEALKLHRSSYRLVLYDNTESYEGIVAVFFYFSAPDITTWQQDVALSGVHQEPKCSLFQLQCNAIDNAHQALPLGYVVDGQSSIWLYDELSILSQETTVKCLSDDGCWITFSLLDVQLSHGWILVDHDSATAFDLISDTTLMATKDYIWESFSVVHANTNAHVRSLEFSILNLEDKVLFEDGSIVVNQADSIRAYGLEEGNEAKSNGVIGPIKILESFIWDPGPFSKGLKGH